MHSGAFLVDLQVNGLLGVSFSSELLSIDDVGRVTEGLAERGTGAYLATIVTCPWDRLIRNVSLIADAGRREENRGRLLGIHIEGPFLSPAEGARGAHRPDWMLVPTVERVDELIDAGDGMIRLMTVAAGIEGVEQAIARAAERGVVVSLGHQDCDADALRRAVDAGAGAMTHLGNGIAAKIDRHDNPIWYALDDDRLTAMLIADGEHLPDHLLRVVYRVKGPRRTILTSDAAPIAGLADGDYESFGVPVTLRDGRISLRGTSYLAGSAATMLECVNRFAEVVGIDEDDLWAIARDTPLATIGADLADCSSPDIVRFDSTSRTFLLSSNEGPLAGRRADRGGRERVSGYEK